MSTDHFGLAEGDYVPDPERDTTLLLDAFYEHLTASLRDHALPAGLTNAMRARQSELEAANRPLVVDGPARQNLRMSLALVAAYEYLRPRLGREAAIGAVQEAFIEPLGDAVREGTRERLDSAPDAFQAIVEMSRSREEHAFGKGFVFECSADDGERYHVDVRRCFFNDVMVANGTPELTRVMCAFDANWIEAIVPERHGFRFDRPTTIGTGHPLPVPLHPERGCGVAPPRTATTASEGRRRLGSAEARPGTAGISRGTAGDGGVRPAHGHKAVAGALGRRAEGQTMKDSGPKRPHATNAARPR